jgi:DNA-binding response OmpR family regulator
MKGRILLVEDEANFGQVLKSYLELSDYRVDLATDGDVGYSRFKSSEFDLCILDVMMPKRDGFSLAEDIRKIDRRVPLIFLTARGEKEDQIKGYRSGADDYLTKPFDSEVLLLKIERILERNGEEKKPEVLEIGRYRYSPAKRLLELGDHSEKLSPKEGALLEMLVRYTNRVMPRSEALIKIWKNDDYFTTRSMDVYVAKLRKKLERDEAIQIENVHGTGYILHVEN